MKRMLTLIFCILSVTVSLIAKDTTNVAGVYSGGSEGSLNDAIETAINNGTLSSTVFKLYPYDWYVLTATIKVPAGEVLELVAPDPKTDSLSAPPQILWTASGSVRKDFMISVYGDLIMKNIWIRYADVAGIQTGTPIVFDGDTLGATVDDGEFGTFEGCVFDWMPCPEFTASGSVCVRSEKFNGVFKNCYFRNCVDSHYMYYGRAVSFPFDVPGYHTESVSFENCTFANMGYVYMQERTNYADNVSFNHCTFYNVVMFSLESGWWWKLNVTNCLFVNAYMMGYVPAAGVSGATVTIEQTDSIDFAIPFTDHDRHILFAHSAYYIEEWLVDWMRGGWEKYARGTEWRPDARITEVGCPFSKDLYTQRIFDEIPYPRPMLDSTALVYFDSTDAEGNKLYPLINRAALYDISSVDVSSQDARNALNPGFAVPPLNKEPLKYFLNEKWGTNQDSMWAYDVEASFLQKWPLPENLTYTNETYKSAGMGGFPLGDLYHWWNPAIRAGATDYYSAWLAQSNDEREKLAQWLETGIHPDSSQSSIRHDVTVLAKYTLSQNYPNPFNPTTNIEYTVPVKSQIFLDVYNVLGQKVSSLVNSEQNAGAYTVTFDGSELSAGIYFYRLQSESVNLTKKFILLK